MRHVAFLSILLLAVLAMPAPAQVAISPIIQEVRLDEPAKILTVRLSNFEDKPKQVEVSVANWTLDEEGDIRRLPSDETSLDRWLIVSPLRFELAADSVQTIRVAIRPAVELAPGEHRAMIYFDEKLSPRAAGDTRLRGAFRIGTAVYAYQGEPRRIGHITSLQAGGDGLRARMTSEGNAHARLQGFYAVWRADAFPGLAASPLAALATAPDRDRWPEAVVDAGTLPSLPVLPGIARPLHVPFGKLAPGRYVLEFRGGMSGVSSPEALPFTVSAPASGR